MLAAGGAAALRSLIAAARTDLLSAEQRAKLDPVLTSLRLLDGTASAAGLRSACSPIRPDTFATPSAGPRAPARPPTRPPRWLTASGP